MSFRQFFIVSIILVSISLLSLVSIVFMTTHNSTSYLTGANKEFHHLISFNQLQKLNFNVLHETNRLLNGYSVSSAEIINQLDKAIALIPSIEKYPHGSSIDIKFLKRLMLETREVAKEISNSDKYDLNMTVGKNALRENLNASIIIIGKLISKISEHTTLYLDSVQAQQKNSKRFSIIFSIIVLLSMSVWFFVMMSRYNRRISIIRKGIVNYSKGNFDTAITLDTGDEFGELVNMINQMVFDIKDLNAQLIQSSKLATLGEMAAGMAHEINNPLAIIGGNAQLLEMLAKDPEKNHELIKEVTPKINETVLRISQIITGLKNFSHERQDEQSTPASIFKIIDETSKLCGERLAVHGIELSYETIPKGLLINCHEVQISQILLNLINNAFDELDNIDKEEKLVKITHHTENNFDVISVIDNGPGIPPEVLDKIFQPFYTTKEVGKGTGLGLSISKGIMEKHGGKLEINTEENETQFKLCFPRDEGR